MARPTITHGSSGRLSRKACWRQSVRESLNQPASDAETLIMTGTTIATAFPAIAPPRSSEPGGTSALEHSEEIQLTIDQLSAQLVGLNAAIDQLTATRDGYLKGGRGEAAVVAVIRRLAGSRWTVLADRAWPGTRAANIDAILVGPGGVLVVDVKTWSAASVRGGHLWDGTLLVDDQVAKLRSQADTIGALLSPEGYPPSQVAPVMVFASGGIPTQPLGGVTLASLVEFPKIIAGTGVRLDAAQVAQIVATLERDCPRRPRATNRRKTKRPPAPPQDALFDPHQLVTDMLEAACGLPLETWMTWLHPEQNQLVSRTFNGPARIRGAAGTGKTVVALHRAKWLAEHSTGKVLVTSFIRTLPTVQANLFTRMAPHLRDRVEFTHLHSWANQLLIQRGQRPPIKDPRTAFNLAWARVGAHGPLGNLPLRPDYWWDEVQAVIKGRGLTDIDDYLALNRLGRRTALREAHRQAVWELYETYENVKAERGTWDWADVITAALTSVRDQPVNRYDAVVVDEVQDFTAQGVRLLHTLVADKPNGLLLVGDGQQSIYTGAFTTTEAGINIKGRSIILRRNYRNAQAIIDRAMSVVDADPYDDLGDPTGHRDTEPERPGGLVKDITADTQESLQAAAHTHVLDLLAGGARPGDIAVLVKTNELASRWVRLLGALGIPVMDLTDYLGLPDDRAKVGTYHRGKGLEFAHVLIPDTDSTPRAQLPDEPDDAYQEAVEQEHRTLFTAMTRARDSLWLGHLQR